MIDFYCLKWSDCWRGMGWKESLAGRILWNDYCLNICTI